jgi:hypothetical protein
MAGRGTAAVRRVRPAEAAAAAHRLGESWVLKEIGVLGDIRDAAAGSVTIRLPADAHRVSVTLLRLSARAAARTTSRAPGRQRPAGPCPACEEPAIPGARYCVRCGQELS